jgi:acetyl esterase
VTIRSTLERAGALALFKLPRRVLVRLAGGKRTVVEAGPIDEQVQILLKLAALLGRKNNEELTIAEARRSLDADATLLGAPMPPLARIENRVVRDGELAVRIRIYVPRALEARRDAPALVFFHGGGFVLGSIASHENICAEIADRVPCVVVSVDYRLAPEAKFPAGIDDSVGAFRWVRAHATELGVDPERIAVGGDSAGGNVAAVVCHDLAKAGGPTPRFQLLVYPATDLTCSARSHALFARGFFLEAPTIRFYIDQYIRTPADIDDPRASPLKSTSFAGLPPAMVITAGFDPLRDEGKAYADALAAAGVDVTYRNDAGMVHGYFAMSGAIDVAKDAMSEAVRELREALDA